MKTLIGFGTVNSKDWGFKPVLVQAERYTYPNNKYKPSAFLTISMYIDADRKFKHECYIHTLSEQDS